jgi:membrane-bound lytic murein transglycosylase B
MLRASPAVRTRPGFVIGLAGLAFATAVILTFLTAVGTARADSPPPPFQEWLDGVRAEGLERGLSPETLDAALTGLLPIERVLELDRRQPEFTRTFWGYLNSFVGQARIERGREMLDRHGPLLREVAAQYGVQPRFLVAFWGMETNFGDYTGDFPVVASVATLAHDPRRSEFFRAQLFDALTILDEGHIPASRMKGSWAGAMGQLQFIPSTFTGHAVDGDGDGRKDIWGSLPDVFSSGANYLSNLGWTDEETWGREVLLPAGFDFELADPAVVRPIADWQAMGVRRANGADLPAVDIEGRIVVPAGAGGPAFLVYGNFERILSWNRSTYYALAVGHLSDRLQGMGPLTAKPDPNDAPLSRDQILALQQTLNDRGFEAGEPDGMVGPMTRGAVRAYQKSVGLPPDGYPTPALIDRLMGE